MPNIDLNITVRKLIEEFKNMEAGWAPYEIPETEGEAFLQKTEEMCSEIKLLFESLKSAGLLRHKSSTWKEPTLTFRSTAFHFAEEMESMIKLFATIYNNKDPEDGQRHNDLPDAVAWVKNMDSMLMVPDPQNPELSETDVRNLFAALMRSNDRNDDRDTDFNTLCVQLTATERPEEDGNTDEMIMEFSRKVEEAQNRITNDLTPLYCQLVSGIISHMTTITDDLMPGALKLTEIMKMITERFPSAQHTEIYTTWIPELTKSGSIVYMSQRLDIQNYKLFAFMTETGKDSLPKDIAPLLRQQIMVQAAKCRLISSNETYVINKTWLFSLIEIKTCDHDPETCVWAMAPSFSAPLTEHSPTVTMRLQNIKQISEEIHKQTEQSKRDLRRQRARLLEELAENMNQMKGLISVFQEEAYPLSLQLAEIDGTSKQELQKSRDHIELSTTRLAENTKEMEQLITEFIEEVCRRSLQLTEIDEASKQKLQELQELRHHIELSTTRLAENMKEMEQLTTELIEEPFRQSLRLTEIGVTREARGQLVEQFTARHTEIPLKLEEIARTGKESSAQASLQEWQDEIKQSVEQFIEQFRDQLLEHAEAATEEQEPVAATTMNVGDVEQHQQTTEQQSDPHPTLIHSGFVIR